MKCGASAPIRVTRTPTGISSPRASSVSASKLHSAGAPAARSASQLARWPSRPASGTIIVPIERPIASRRPIPNIRLAAAFHSTTRAFASITITASRRQASGGSAVPRPAGDSTGDWFMAGATCAPIDVAVARLERRIGTFVQGRKATRRKSYRLQTGLCLTAQRGGRRIGPDRDSIDRPGGIEEERCSTASDVESASAAARCPVKGTARAAWPVTGSGFRSGGNPLSPTSRRRLPPSGRPPRDRAQNRGSPPDPRCLAPKGRVGF